MNTNTSGKNLPSINMISEGTELNGNLSTKNDIRIAGRLKGEAKAKGKLIISSTGVVDGDVDAVDADIAGTLKGEIHVSNKLILRQSAVIEGDIYTKSILVEEGAKVNGGFHMGNESDSSASSSSSPGSGSKSSMFSSGSKGSSTDGKDEEKEKDQSKDKEKEKAE